MELQPHLPVHFSIAAWQKGKENTLQLASLYVRKIIFL